MGHARFGAHITAEGLIGPAPGVMPALGLDVLAALDEPQPWSPALVLGVFHGWRTGVEEQGATASFMLDAASLDLCPLRLRSSVVEVRPRASALGGRLSARGTKTRNAAGDSSRPFWVLGGAALLTADFGGFIEPFARVAVGGNIVQDSFTFTPIRFHTVPAVTVAASLGFGVRSR